MIKEHGGGLTLPLEPQARRGTGPNTLILAAPGEGGSDETAAAPL